MAFWLFPGIPTGHDSLETLASISAGSLSIANDAHGGGDPAWRFPCESGVAEMRIPDTQEDRGKRISLKKLRKMESAEARKKRDSIRVRRDWRTPGD
jgi:hypothetical protein